MNHYSQTSVQIAKREGISAATVRKRLSRAIEQLRVKLDGEYGDRRSWLAALLPLARTPERTLFGSAGLGAGFIGFVSSVNNSVGKACAWRSMARR